MAERSRSLLRLAQADFDVFVTIDKNLPFQQNLRSFSLGVIILEAPDSKLGSLEPLMQNVLADLALESEAATVLMLRLAGAFDARYSNEQEHGFADVPSGQVPRDPLFVRREPAIAEGRNHPECLQGLGVANRHAHDPRRV